MNLSPGEHEVSLHHYQRRAADIDFVLEASDGSLVAIEVKAAARRSSTNARMISTFTATARSLRKTPESIATPCSVKT